MQGISLREIRLNIIIIVVKVVAVVVVSYHTSFLPGTSLEPMVTPLLRIQVSDCSTFHNMYHVPNIAVF
jgi:hypothetical protein